MTLRPHLIALLIATCAISAACLALPDMAGAARLAHFDTPDAARAEYNRARKQARDAAARANALTRQAGEAKRTADRSAREAAALAARIQQSQADIAAERARLALITDRRRVLDERLARRQQPIVRLTAALQNMSRRPMVLSALQPGSLKDTVHVRAVLEAAVPAIRRQTAGVRAQLASSRQLEAEAASALDDLRQQEKTLGQRRQSLAAMELRQRRASRQARGIAVQENERALALAEQARDLDDLVGELGKAARIRAQLAALPGPILRPSNPGAAAAMAASDPRSAQGDSADENTPPPGYRLPVDGRIVTGYGAIARGGIPSTGLAIATRDAAQVVAPSAGRVAFAGAYRGFDQVVIIEHDGGWTTLLTGLADATVAVGDTVLGGSPIGAAGDGGAQITLELRRGNDPVNPLDAMG